MWSRASGASGTWTNMKILHLTSKYAPAGGIETYVLETVPLLERFGHKNAVIFREDHPGTPSVNGDTLLRIPYSENPAGDRATLIREVTRLEPDIIYLHDYLDARAILQVTELAPVVGYVHIFYPVCPGLGKLYRRSDRVCPRAFGLGCIPKIYTERCASARNPRSVYWLMRNTQRYLHAYRSLPRVVVGSQYMYDLMLQNGIAADRVDILPLFVPVPSPDDLAEIPQDATPTILFAGRLEYEKGLPYLLEASSRIQTPHRLLIAGNGSRAAEYRELAHTLKVAHRCQFTDWLSTEGLYEAYRQAHVTVMPTLMPEPFGKVGVEAMANGRPVVAFDVGGIPDWLVDGETGYLVPSGNVEMLAQRIETILRDRALATRLGAQARRRVAELYNEERHVTDLVKIFEDVRRNHAG